MIDFGVSLNQMKRGLFDRQAVISAVETAERKALSRFGAFVRRSARSSIRKAKGPSKPGKPPHSHVGLLKQFILFSYDRSRGSVIIGPALLTGHGSDPDRLAALEGGGMVTLRRRNKAGKMESVQVHIKARPFMGPALRKEEPKLPDLLRNAMSKIGG